MNPRRYIFLSVAIVFYACSFQSLAQDYITTPMNGPFGGPGTNMISTPSGDPLVAIAVGGMWTSTDGGWNWHTLNGGLDARVPTRLFNDPVTGDAYGVMNDGVLYRLDESAGRWVMAGALPAPDAHCFRHTDGLFYAVDPGNAVYTSSNGTDWDVLYTGSTYTKPLSFVPAPNGMLFIGTDFNGVYRSTDNGGTWLQCFELTAEVRKLFISPGDTIYATTNFGFFGSGDWGETWIRDAKYPAQDSSEFRYTDGTLVTYITDEGLAIIPAGQQAWQIVRAVLHHDAIRHLVRTQDDSLIAYTGRGGFITGDNGLHWYPYIESGVGRYAFDRVIRVADGTLYTITNGSPGNIAFAKSTDNGISWSVVVDGLYWIDDWSVSDNGSLLQMNGLSISVSTDNGQSWIESVKEAPHGLDDFSSDAVTFGSDERIILGAIGYIHPDDRFDTLYVSDDYGSTWKAAVNMGIDRGHFVRNHDLIWNALTSGYSTDNGDTWQASDRDFSRMIGRVYSITDEPGVGMFLATDHGLFLGNGLAEVASFTRLVEGNVFCYLAEDLESIITGTNGSGVYLTERVPSFVNQPSHAASAHISSVYPNPVILSASVNYTLQAQSSISLRLVDVLGRTIATIVEGTHAPGTHTATLSTAALKPGTYFLRLETPRGVRVKPVAVVR